MTTKNKARAIFTNDAECDDMNSMLHMLLYANDIDIEGIVLSSSIFHYAGDPERGIEPKRWAGDSWMWEYLDAYEQVYPNLAVHDPEYPTADELRAVTCVGNVKTIGDMDEDTDGSELIRRAIFSDDPRPVYLLAGGGTNTIARALKRIEADWRETDEWERVYRQVCEKAIIYMIVTQDETYYDYIMNAWPDVRILHGTSILGVAFIFNEELCPATCLHTYRGDWLKEHVLDKGPLCAHYHTWFDGHVYPGEEPRSQFGSNLELAGGNWWGRGERSTYDFISEGDSPSFFYLIDKGLRSTEDPGFGGWGGRFERGCEMPRADRSTSPVADGVDYWRNASDADCGPTKGEAYQLTRWMGDIMNDFASRAQWCVAERFEDANHAPEVTVAEGLDLEAHPGQDVVLHAQTSDVDGDELSVSWFDYPEAGTYGSSVAIDQDDTVATVHVPDDAEPGQTIHAIVAVRDDADPARDTYMVAYRRVIITVA